MPRMNYRKSIFFLLMIMAASNSYSQTDSSQYFLKKGDEEKAGRRFRSAEISYLSGLRFQPGNKTLMTQLADTYREQFKYNEARDLYLKLAKENAADPVILSNLMTISFNMHKWEDAIQYAQRSINDPAAEYIIGRSQYELENYGEAVNHLNQAEKTQPVNAAVPYYLGRAYMEQSNYKLSAAALERAIQVDTSKANWVYETGLAFYAIPDYQKSLQYILLAGTRGYPRSNDYLENLANVFVRTNQHPEAIKIFKEVLLKKPSDQELLFQLAQSYYATKQYDEAIASWNKILTADASNADAMYMMGLSYQKKGDMAKGSQLCEQAIKIKPSLKNFRQEKKTEF